MKETMPLLSCFMYLIFFTQISLVQAIPAEANPVVEDQLVIWNGESASNITDGTLTSDPEHLFQGWPALEAAYPAGRIRIFRGSVWNEDGYPEAFKWLAGFF